MNRNFISKKIKRHGQPWFKLGRDNELTPFNGFLTNKNANLWVTDKPLSLGSLVHPAEAPDRLYLVMDRTDTKYYEDYDVEKITNYATVLRFSPDQQKDTFGRSVNSGPALIYSALPLLLNPGASDKAQDSPDRSSTSVSYRFATSGKFELKPKDRLTIGDTQLVIDAVLVSPDGLLEFRATATA